MFHVDFNRDRLKINHGQFEICTIDITGKLRLDVPMCVLKTVLDNLFTKDNASWLHSLLCDRECLE